MTSQSGKGTRTRISYQTPDLQERNILLEEDDDVFKPSPHFDDGSDSDDAFYTTEEGTVARDPETAFSGNDEKNAQKEEMYKRSMGDRKDPHLSAKQSQFHHDQEKWENRQMQSSGVIDGQDDQVSFTNSNSLF